MPEICELCGKFDNKLVEAIVEGAMVSVCQKCVNFGHVIPIEKSIKQQIPKRKIVIEKEPEEFEIITREYAQKVKQTREKLDLKQEELAKNIAEKVSVIHKIESGHLKPSLALAKKIEHFLNIKLIEKYKEEKSKTIDFTSSSLTIGDLLKHKK